MSSLIESVRPINAIRIVRDPRPERPPIRTGDDDAMSPEKVEAQLRTFAEARRDRGITESAWIAGGYRVDYQRLWDRYQAVLLELARAKDVLSRVDDAYFPDELPDYHSN